MSPDKLLEKILTRFSQSGFSQVASYNRFTYLRATNSSVYVGRENGEDTNVSYAKILRGIEAYQQNPDWYDEGPSKLREASLAHITSPIYSLLHLLKKEEYK